MEAQMETMRANLGEWKQTVKELMEANQRLTLENEQLRKILKRDAPLDPTVDSACFHSPRLARIVSICASISCMCANIFFFSKFPPRK